MKTVKFTADVTAAKMRQRAKFLNCSTAETDNCKQNISVTGLVVGQEKDVSLFLDRTGEPATQQQVSSRLKNKDTFFSQPTTHPLIRKQNTMGLKAQSTCPLHSKMGLFFKSYYKYKTFY